MEAEEFLEHHGIKGQRWGVRRGHIPGVSSGTNRAAKKDAQEFARAKLFFGEGAGTRRKLIKNTVEAKSKRDPSYKKAFDQHLGNQDLSQHASKAKAERGRIDKAKTAKRSAGLVARKLTGEMGTTAAFTAAAIAGAGFLASPKGQATMRKGTTAVKVWAGSGRARSTTKYVADFMAKQG